MRKIETATFFKSKKLILEYLQIHNLGSTEEIIQFVSENAEECRDKVPQALISLTREGKVMKELSKEKKAFVWFLQNKN